MASALRIFNGLAPAELPKGIRFELDFSAANVLEIDLQKEQTSGEIEMIQSMWIDARLFPARIDMEITGIPMTISIPAFTQGMYPVLCGGIFKCKFTTIAAVPQKPIFTFLNVPQPYFVYTPGV